MSRAARETLPRLRATRATTASGSMRWKSCSPNAGWVQADELAAGHSAARDGAGASACAARRRGRRRAGARLADMAPEPAAGAVRSRATACAPRSGPVAHHTRLPAYVRGRAVSSNGSTAATSSPTAMRRVWASSRSGCTAWSSTRPNCGATKGPPGHTLSVDAWESYLVPAMTVPATAARPAAGQPSRCSPSRGRRRPSRWC